MKSCAVERASHFGQLSSLPGATWECAPTTPYSGIRLIALYLGPCVMCHNVIMSYISSISLEKRPASPCNCSNIVYIKRIEVVLRFFWTNLLLPKWNYPQPKMATLSSVTRRIGARCAGATASQSTRAAAFSTGRLPTSQVWFAHLCAHSAA